MRLCLISRSKKLADINRFLGRYFLILLIDKVYDLIDASRFL